MIVRSFKSHQLLNSLKYTYENKDILSFTQLIRNSKESIKVNKPSKEYIKTLVSTKGTSWDPNVYVDVVNSLYLVEEPVGHYYKELHNKTHLLDSISFVKLVHLISKQPKDSESLLKLLEPRVEPSLEELSRTPHSFGVALGSLIQLKTKSLKPKKVIELVREVKWSLLPKHTIKILSYSSGSFQEALLEELLPLIKFYVKHNLLISEDFIRN